MKNMHFITTLAVSAFLLLANINTFAQNRRAILGNGQLVPVEIPTLEPFTAIEIEGIPGGNGGIQLMAGETASVTILADDNLADLFEITQKNGRITVSMPKNKNNRLWIEDTHIQIVIKTPVINKIMIDGNMNAVATSLDIDNLQVQKAGNGNLTLSGKADKLDLNKTGNGNVDAQNLIVKNAEVQSMGNGSVSVNASETLQTDRSGNGDILQTGAGKVSKGINMGNGEVISREEAKKLKESPAPEYVSITLVNDKARSRDFTVRGRVGNKFRQQGRALSCGDRYRKQIRKNDLYGVEGGYREKGYIRLNIKNLTLMCVVFLPHITHN
jgi:hypothetical protein